MATGSIIAESHQSAVAGASARRSGDLGLKFKFEEASGPHRLFDQ